LKTINIDDDCINYQIKIYIFENIIIPFQQTENIENLINENLSYHEYLSLDNKFETVISYLDQVNINWRNEELDEFWQSLTIRFFGLMDKYEKISKNFIENDAETLFISF
jgi:hypothetical protein